MYFGYPRAHEDDPLRSVQAALSILEALDQVNDHLEATYQVRLAVRVGIHTGVAVVEKMAEGGGQGPLALGPTPNLAARLQALAVPNSVVISIDTYRLVEGHVICQALGALTLRGWPQPLEVFRVLQTGDARTRFAARAAGGLTPMVGRTHELGVLCEQWYRARSGHGHVVLVSGEAGIGKSRLLHALKDQLDTETHTLMECQGSPYYQHTSFWPLTELLQRIFQWQPEETTAEKQSKLEQSVERLLNVSDESIPLLAALLGLPQPEGGHPSLSVTPQRQRQKTLETLVALFDAWAAQQPLVLLVEDLHWIDPSSRHCLELLIDHVQATAMLIVVTSRPTEPPSWVMRPHVTPLNLGRLEPTLVDEMIRHTSGDSTLRVDVRQHIASITDGVPFFVEEVTKLTLEMGQEQKGRDAGAEIASTLTIPATLQDMLMARLDQAGPSKAVAQLGAVLGRTFDYEFLRVIAASDEETLQEALQRLVAADLIYQQTLPPRATYNFKHALIRDIAYQSLLRRTRQEYHQRIAQALEEQFSETASTHPELLAHHYSEAGLNEQAVSYWQRAGRLAINRSAHAEAINHLTKGLEVLSGLPETRERTQHELGLQTTLGSALIAIKGYAAPEVEQAYTRARELCQQLGETPRLLQVLLGLQAFYLVRGKFETARELGEQSLALAMRIDNPARLTNIHYAMGLNLVHLGEFITARSHLEQGVMHYDPQHHHAHHSLQDPGVVCLAYGAWALWWLGYPDQALNRLHEALLLAQQLAHPFSLVFAHYCKALIHRERREAQAAYEQAQAAIALSTEQGFPFWGAGATILQGWALIEQGQREEGQTQMHQGLAAWRSTGAEIGLTYWSALLAEAYGSVEQSNEGLAMLAEAQAVGANTGERLYEAELYRIQGELLLRQSPENQDAADVSFRQAIAVARRQQAMSLTLRAVMSLTQLWQHQGKRAAAYDLLAPIYGWFKEGFDAAELRRAKKRLEELS